MRRVNRIVLLALCLLVVAGSFAASASRPGSAPSSSTRKQWFERAFAGRHVELRLRQRHASRPPARSTPTAGRAAVRAALQPPVIVSGTTQLHNGDDLTVDWKIQCK